MLTRMRAPRRQLEEDEGAPPAGEGAYDAGEDANCLVCAGSVKSNMWIMCDRVCKFPSYPLSIFSLRVDQKHREHVLAPASRLPFGH